MDLYTIFLEFRGGTYIKQVRAIDLNEALDCWAQNIDVHSISNFGYVSKQQLIELMPGRLGQGPIALDRAKNVWCTSARLATGYALIHIVKTLEE